MAGAQVFQEEIDMLRERNPGLVDPILETPAGTYLKLAINTTKLRRRAFAALDDLLKNNEPKFAFNEGAPFAISSKEDSTKVITYPNIPRSVDPVTLASHTNQLWSDGRRRRRIEDPERAETFAMKREVTTLGKFLMKHSNLQTLGYKDDSIRSLCEKISVKSIPPRVVTCESVEDYHQMFKVKTGSCMEVGTHHWGTWSSKDIKQIAEDTGIYIAAWYHYAPWCKGAYVLVGGVPVARFMLYREDLSKEEWPFYGDVRGSSVNYKSVMDEFLAEQGSKPYGKYASTIADFRIPGMTHPLLEKKHGGNQMFCPLGNMDNQRKDFSVMFDDESKEFYFCKTGDKAGATAITDTYRWEGFIPSSKVAKYR